jgi:uncharacterized protein YciI
MKYQILMLTALFIFSANSSAMAQNKPPERKEAPAPVQNPAYDAELAKRLGADKIGMRKYVLAILRTGPKDAEVTDKEKRAELFKGHFRMINRLADEGKLALAGPFNDEKREYRGLYVFNVETIEEAQKLTETDPSIQAGIFKVEFVKWYGSAAVMEVNGIHNRITQQKP